jgi:hypothetical protein
MANYHIDFRLLKNFGLSLNEKKRYFMIYDPQTWSLMYVFDNLKDACDIYHMSVEEWESICDKNAASMCPYTQKYTRDFVGHNDIFYKGFLQNLPVWDLLEQLRMYILDDYLWEDDTEEAMNHAISCIDEKLQSYPDSVLTTYAKIY